MKRKTFVSAAGATLASAALRAPAKAYASAPDLLVYGATLHTVDPQTPHAQAFVVRNGRFAFVGSYADAKRFAGAGAKRLNLHGSTVLPGLIDAHIHLQSVGLDLNEVNLRDSLTFDEVVARTVAFAKHSPDAWILGDGWDQNRWPDKAFPTHDKLSAAIPQRPVALGRVDGHALLLNKKAMQIAGITRTTPDPAGGRILRDANGEPTGVFIDNAMHLIAPAIPEPTLAQYKRATQSASAEAHRFGLTSVADPGCDRDKLLAYEHLAHANVLNLRTYAMIADDLDLVKEVIALPPIVAAQDGVLWIRSIKMFADGALGSRGAALLEPYTDDPSTGLMRTTQAHMETVCDLALANDFQVNTHAIGDRGNRTVLDAYEAALRRNPKRDHRFRVEHAQILSAQDIPRFAQLGVIPSMQTTHQISDMGWAQNRLGPERILGGYAWRTLLNTGVIIPNGTDAPVEVVSTLRTFHAAISRQDEANQPPGGWYPSQRMTRDEAIKSMTIWAAHANFQEAAAGSISRGKYADFVVMDRDWMTAPAEAIMGTRIQGTYFAGAAVYEAPAQHAAAVASPRGLRSRLHRPCACG